MEGSPPKFKPQGRGVGGDGFRRGALQTCLNNNVLPLKTSEEMFQAYKWLSGPGLLPWQYFQNELGLKFPLVGGGWEAEGAQAVSNAFCPRRGTASEGQMAAWGVDARGVPHPGNPGFLSCKARLGRTR